MARSNQNNIYRFGDNIAISLVLMELLFLKILDLNKKINTLQLINENRRA